jgi:hypothetical protein
VNAVKEGDYILGCPIWGLECQQCETFPAWYDNIVWKGECTVGFLLCPVSFQFFNENCNQSFEE